MIFELALLACAAEGLICELFVLITNFFPLLLMNIMAEQQDDFEQTISSLLARASTDSEKIQILIDLVRQQRAELIRLKAEKEQQVRISSCTVK